MLLRETAARSPGSPLADSSAGGPHVQPRHAGGDLARRPLAGLRGARSRQHQPDVPPLHRLARRPPAAWLRRDHRPVASPVLVLRQPLRRLRRAGEAEEVRDHRYARSNDRRHGPSVRAGRHLESRWRDPVREEHRPTWSRCRRAEGRRLPSRRWRRETSPTAGHSSCRMAAVFCTCGCRASPEKTGDLRGVARRETRRPETCSRCSHQPAGVVGGIRDALGRAIS